MGSTLPKVAISVGGRFHAFNLAHQLEKRGALTQLLTSYPGLEARKYGVTLDRVTGFPLLEVASRIWNRTPMALREGANAQLFFADLFDRFARNGLREGSNLFVGWSSTSLHTLQRARALGMVTVIERGSSHIATQQELLEDEFRRFGRVFRQTHPGVIEKEQMEYAAADYIAIPGKFAKRTFLERGIPEEKLIVSPYGVDLARFSPTAREDDTFRVIYCGALSLRKGVPYLLEAFANLNLPNAELWLVGAVMPEIIPTLAKYSLPNIKVLGPRRQNELKKFYGQCDLFCLPSIEDGFGMVIPQAMACGLPVLTTTNTGGEDLVTPGREGWVVPIRDARAIADNIRWGYENRAQLAEMGQAARSRVAGGLTWDDYGARNFELYVRALAVGRVDRRAA